MNYADLVSAFESCPPGTFHELQGTLEIGLDDAEPVALRVANGSARRATRGEQSPTGSIRLKRVLLDELLAGSADLRVRQRRGEVQIAPWEEGPVLFVVQAFGRLIEQRQFAGPLAASPLASCFRALTLAESKSGISASCARRLYDLVRATRARRTLEVGLARGMSALAIALALTDEGEDGHHVAIDPFQLETYSNAALANLAGAGLSHRVTHLDLPDFVALPKLLAERHEFDVIFVDGSHFVDYTFLDVFFAERLLRLGGYLALDDVHLAEVDVVVQHLLNDRAGSFAAEPRWSGDRMSVFRKIGPDDRLDRGVLAPGGRRV